MQNAMLESVRAIAQDIARREYFRGLRLLLQGFDKTYIRATQLHVPMKERIFNHYSV